MSDNSVTVVDIEVSKRDAKAAAARVVEFLVDRGIVQKQLTKCILAQDKKGHAPGPNYAKASGKVYPQIVELAVNGLEVCIGREVFTAFENGLAVKCPKCKHETADPDDAFMDAAGQWHLGDDDVQYACPKCGKSQKLVLWDGPFPWGFGNVGFTFWNWPDLKPAFVREVAKVLGHDVRVVRAHL